MNENVRAQIAALAEATGRTPEEVEQFVRYMAEQQERHVKRSAIYTNRAARRARARNEREQA